MSGPNGKKSGDSQPSAKISAKGASQISNVRVGDGSLEADAEDRSTIEDIKVGEPNPTEKSEGKKNRRIAVIAAIIAAVGAIVAALIAGAFQCSGDPIQKTPSPSATSTKSSSLSVP